MKPDMSRSELLDEARAANVLMDQHRGQMAIAAHWRAVALARLRGDGMAVTEIAGALGVTPAAIYKASGELNVGIGAAESSEAELNDLRGRIAAQLSITLNIIEGRTPEAMSRHGWQLLANDLGKVLKVLEP